MSNTDRLAHYAGRIENLAFLAEQLCDDLNKECENADQSLASCLEQFESDLSEAESILRPLKLFANTSLLLAQKRGW